MRIGLVVPGFSKDADDWCIPALRHLGRALSRADDVHVRVIAVRYPYHAARYSVEGADVIALGGADSHRSATLALWRETLDVLRLEHRQRAFDVLHAFWATESGLLTAVAGRLLRIPTLVSLAGGELVALPEIGYGDQRLAWERLKVHASLRLASAVSAGSRKLLAMAEPHVPSARLHRAPLGVDVSLFQHCPSQAPAADARLVHVGTLTGVKDQATLLRAFRLVRQRMPHATLDIVGDGPRRPELERLAATLGIAQAVRFAGDVDHGALPSLYRAGRAFVLSSRHEAQGMVALEAAACGLPVAGTCVGVVPELAASGEAVVPVGAAEALANAITCTLAGPAARGQAAREVAQTEFGLEPCTARFRALYSDLIER